MTRKPHRVRVARACRTFLRDALAGSAPLDAQTRNHIEACADCAARLAARDRLLAPLRQRPQLPGGAFAGKFAGSSGSEAVHERIVETAAQSPIVQALAAAPAVPAAVCAADAWTEGLMAGSVARSVGEPPNHRVSAAAWSRVRESILGEVAGRSTRRLQRRWALGFGAAAAITVVGLLLSRTPPEQQTPTIVFRDLATMPGVDFAVVRYGATR